MESLWEELPRPLTVEELREVRSYAYPPRRAMAYANRPPGEGDTAFPGREEGAAAPFSVDRRGSFSYRWVTGPHAGVELVLLWARHGSGQPFVPLAASATVVAEPDALPPALAFWRRLGESLDRLGEGEP